MDNLNYDSQMTRLLLIIFFVGSVGCNSLAAVFPHTSGDGGCSVACCDAARRKGPNSKASSLCCLVDCNQPGHTNSSSSGTQVSAALQKKQPPARHIFWRLETSPTVRRLSFPDSPTRNVAGSSDRYLETGTLLI
jgi:hypothetical protein